MTDTNYVKQEPVAWIELLREARDNCKASIVEEGINATRKEYRIDLEARLSAALNAAPQPVQEPDYFGLTHDHTWLSIDKKQYDKLKPECRMACYAAPVRTKDLTDEQWTQSELFKLAVSRGLLTLHTEFVAAPVDTETKVSWMEGHATSCDISNEAARAVIAAYKEKSRG